MYKCVLFDMDGTLVDTYEGIYNSYKYAFRKMGMKFSGGQFVGEVIGAPLLSVFKQQYSLGEKEAVAAAGYYREYYTKRGKDEVTVYEGIRETLRKLKGNCYRTGVATLKRESFARQILNNLDLTKYFDVIYGIDENDKLTKADLVEKCILQLEIPKKEVILVGDSEYDAQGARAAGIDFMAVTYGYGFKEPESLQAYEIVRTARTGYEIGVTF